MVGRVVSAETGIGAMKTKLMTIQQTAQFYNKREKRRGFDHCIRETSHRVSVAVLQDVRVEGSRAPIHGSFVPQ